MCITSGLAEEAFGTYLTSLMYKPSPARQLDAEGLHYAVR
jgi:hypothetical protein